MRSASLILFALVSLTSLPAFAGKEDHDLSCEIKVWQDGGVHMTYVNKTVPFLFSKYSVPSFSEDFYGPTGNLGLIVDMLQNGGPDHEGEVSILVNNNKGNLLDYTYSQPGPLSQNFKLFSRFSVDGYGLIVQVRCKPF